MRFYCLFLLGGLTLATPLAAQTLTGDVAFLDRLHLPADNLTFIENRGQWPDEVAFLAQLGGVNVWITDTGLVYDFYELTLAADEPRPEASRLDREAMWRRGHVVRVQFEGAQSPRAEGRGQRSTYHNYFLGNDPARWASHVALYDEVTLHDLYDGVSLRLYEDGGMLRQDVTFAPGIAPDVVQVRLEGVEQFEDAISAPLDRAAILGLDEQPTVRLPEPLARAGAASLSGGDAPIFSTYIGGGDQDRVRELAVGNDGSIFIAGRTLSNGGNPFPTRNAYDPTPNGGNDGYVAQLRSDGVDLLYGTYLGGSGFDDVRGLAYANESVYLTGITTSPNFPTNPGAYELDPIGLDDSFVTQLRPDGSTPTFSTYLGGSGSDAGEAIAIADDNTIVVSGRTFGDFPMLNGSNAGGGDAFVVVLNSDGSDLVNGTYLGGSGRDEVRTLRLGNESIYIAGETDSNDFGGLENPFGGEVDVFVARLESDGSALLGGRYLGGSGLEGATSSASTETIALALGSDGSVYVAGDTSSDDFPRSTGIGPITGNTNAFVTKLDIAATGIVTSTVFGGSDIDRARALDVGPDGSIYVVGETISVDFPDMDNSHSDGLTNFDAFVVQLQDDGAQVLFGTYLGGTLADGAYGVVVADNGLTYVAGETASSDFPTTPSAFDRSDNGAEDAFVAAYDLRPNAPPTVMSPIPDTQLPPGGSPYVVNLNTVFADPGDTLGFTCASSDPGVASASDCADGMLAVTALSTGTTTVTVTATDTGGNSVSDAFLVTVSEENPPPTVMSPIPDQVFQLGVTPPFVVTLGTVFADPGDTLGFTCASSDPGVASASDCADGTLIVMALDDGTTTVMVTATDTGGNSVSDAFLVTVTNPPPTVMSPIPDTQLSLSGSPYVVTLGTVFADPGDTLGFTCASSDPGVASASDCADGMLAVTALSTGTTTVTVTATDTGGNSVSDAFLVTVSEENPPPTVMSPIPDQVFQLGVTPPFVVTLGTVFADPGDTLGFTCASSDPGVASASDCADGTLIVMALDDGTTTVMVTATDTGGNSVSDAFLVTVTNPPPTVMSPIPDQVFQLGVTPPFVVTLGTVFADPGDTLGFTCASSDPGVASASDCADGMLAVTALSTGTTTVTVTATDIGGNSVSDAFLVTVSEENPPPTVTNRIPDLDFELGVTPPFVAALDTVFADPGDTLSFTCESFDSSVAIVSDCADGTLIVMARGGGRTVLRVRATDTNGNLQEITSDVRVTNPPPTVTNRIPDLDFELGVTPPFVAALDTVFADPGDTLSFTCESFDSSVAIVSDCADGTLIVTARGGGRATIIVTATDTDESEVEDVFFATVSEPLSIGPPSHSPAQPQIGEDVTVNATVTGLTEGGSVALRYQQGGASEVQQEDMTESGGSYSATIPGASVTAQGLVYVVEATNPDGSPVRSEPGHLRILVSQGISSTVFAAGLNQTGYRMISVPLALTDSTASTVLAGLETATIETWRVFELLPPGEGEETDSLAAGTNNQQRYREGPADINMTPGEAFWLISRNGGTFNTGSGLTLPTDTSFTRVLHPGWNLIGTPFDLEVPLDLVRLERSGTAPQLQAYEGTWRDETSVMKPFQGYALFVPGEADRLIIEPPLGSAVRPASPPRATNDTGAQGEDAPSWAVRITATVGHARDDNNVAMAMAGAVEGHDGLDWFEPPLIGEYVSVSFAAPPGVDAPLTIDARPIPDEGAVWPLAVRSNLGGPVELTFEGLESVPADFVVWLVDVAGGTVKDLRNEHVHSFASQGNGAAIQLQLIVGSETYAQTTSSFDGTAPTDFHLAQSYPNPFRATTTIQYGLPNAELVKLEVFDVVGRRVAVLVDEEQEQGYHQAIWSASGGGLELASGVYVYRLRAGSFVATKRMIVVK